MKNPVQLARLAKYGVQDQWLKFRERHTYRKVLEAAATNAAIANLLDASTPALIGRFGSTEMLVVGEFENQQPYREKTIEAIQRDSGFFPTEKPYLDRFAQLYTASMLGIDLLGIWYVPKEAYCIKQFCPSSQLSILSDLEPYYHAAPWSSKLAGKRVLVVHPFSDAIQYNYATKRTLLFQDPQVLPPFDLQVYQSVQSLAGNKTQFRDWFEAYDFMCREISQFEFDVAILGCGAYGLPIAAFIKRELQRTAIHLGGATQLLFGIKGKRWDNVPFFRDGLYNEHWSRAGDREKFKNYHLAAEEGCYW